MDPLRKLSRIKFFLYAGFGKINYPCVQKALAA